MGRSRWSTPAARNLVRNLVGSAYDTDRDWHASTMRYGDSWAHDPTWSQHKRAKPTHTDPEDDTKVDPMMPVGSTSKTWNPRADDPFWQRPLEVESAGESQYWTQWKPRLRPEREIPRAQQATLLR